MDLEFWNSFFKIAAMISALCAAGFGGFALYTETRVNQRQSERLAMIGKDVADAKTQQAEAESRLASVELEAQQQRERALNAERTLESERAERTKLDKRTANRWLESDTFNALSSAMAKFSGQSTEVVVFPVNFESVGIADLIQGILLNAKWKTVGYVRRLSEAPQLPTPSGINAPVMVQGVFIRTSGDEPSRTAGRALYEALAKTVASGVYDPSPIPGAPLVFVLIGDKPTPLSVWIRE